VKALILAGSPVQLTAELKRLAAEADYVIAADSGLRHAAPLGVTPQLIVGDFDSVSEEDLARYPETPRDVHPPEKDALDLELALEHARAQGASSVTIIGGLGGRLDQTLAALLIAARLQSEGLTVSLHSGASTVYFLAAGSGLDLALPANTLFSVLSLSSQATLSLKNARYPLNEGRLDFGTGLGVSNRVLKPPLRLYLTSGLVAIVLPHQETTNKKPG
jgi:thiamine pyrophosphokinase